MPKKVSHSATNNKGTSKQQQQEQQAAAMSNQLENIKVAVRLRPFTQKEKERNNKRIVDIRDNTVVLYNLHHNDVQLKKFTFDYSYWSHDGFRRDESGINVPDLAHPNSERYVSQDKVFEDLGSFLLKNALEGYNSALLAYGQTGSGKSYTVSGYGQNEGILPRFARALFIELEKKLQGGRKHSQTTDSVAKKHNREEPEPERGGERSSADRYEVYFSMIEIYNEVVRDLLAKNHADLVAQSSIIRRGLKVREHPKHGFFVENLTSFPCANKDEIESRIEEGQLNKSIAATSMNEMSSRGHTIYEFRIKQYSTGFKRRKNLQEPASGASESKNTKQNEDGGHDDTKVKGEETVTTSVVQLVDLAGSERMAVHVTGGDTFIGSRSNTPYSRNIVDERKPSPRMRTSKIASAEPASASSSNESTSHAAKQQVQSQSQHQHQQQGSLPPIHGSASHIQRFKESVAINQSLSALGNCIQVLSQYSQQLEMSVQSGQAPKRAPPKIPYRDSVLTKLLNRCCLSGNSKVVLIATLSPIDTSYDETLSTLRFADRAKQIRTHATINMVESGQLLNDIKSSKLDSNRIRRSDVDNCSEQDSTINLVDKKSASSTAIDAVATPTRSRRTTRRIGPAPTSSSSSGQTKLANSKSNPSLAVKQEQMRRIVSPASRKLIGSTTSKADANNKSSSKRATHLRPGDEANGGTPDDLDLDDIEEGLISSDDSEDNISLSAFKLDIDGSEEMTTEEKIQLFNRMLNNRNERPRRSNNRGGAGVQKVPILSSSLKENNPYLSNLNPDEQLTGVIGYILKQGETSVGKSKDCDIVLHGPELRGQHARLLRDENNSVYIEPILASDAKSPTGSPVQVALMVNGCPVRGRLALNHCDRLLFGTNAYFVFANNLAAAKEASGTCADLDMVTYDMARNEVLRKYMADGKNEATLREINDYTHRPGTGKHGRIRSADLTKQDALRLQQLGSAAATSDRQQQRSTTTNATKLLRTMTIHDHQEEPFVEMELASQLSAASATESIGNLAAAAGQSSESISEQQPEIIDQEAIYRERLMEDTYEYTLPVAEVNAVAKEMGIKVQYGLKILTGEEQLSDQVNHHQTIDSSNASDGLSVSSSSLGTELGTNETNDRTPAKDKTKNPHQPQQARLTAASTGTGHEWATHLTRLDGLDIPPALYIRVHLEELGLDFYWSKEKFEARRFQILELYGTWDVAGKSSLVEHLIDQSKYQGDYLLDPFVDDPSGTFVLIGHAQITLTPISHMSDLEETFDIIDMDDGTVGSVKIQATPCDTKNLLPPPGPSATNTDDQQQPPIDQSPYRVFSESELEKCLLDSPKHLLNEKLVFRLKIISCQNIPERFHNIFCQYQLGAELPTIRTKLMRETTTGGSIESTEDQTNNSNSGNSESDKGKANDEELVFDHSHYICFDKVNRDILDFLEHGFLTIQVVGQYKLSPEDQQKSPTVISTIIRSINKYKTKIEQDQRHSSGGFNSGGAYPNGGHYFGSQTGSSKSNRAGQSSSGAMNSNSASSVVSTSATVNLFDPQNDDEDGSNSTNSLSQENIIDMILTKRKLDRAENQLVSLQLWQQHI